MDQVALSFQQAQPTINQSVKMTHRSIRSTTVFSGEPAKIPLSSSKWSKGMKLTDDILVYLFRTHGDIFPVIVSTHFLMSLVSIMPIRGDVSYGFTQSTDDICNSLGLGCRQAPARDSPSLLLSANSIMLSGSTSGTPPTRVETTYKPVGNC
jgi:hypothetical protein